MLIAGLALLVVGILYRVNFTKFIDAVPEEYQVVNSVPILCIVVGAIIFVIAFLGCCGTLKSNTCMLNSYGAILFVIFILQIALGIFALVTIKDTDDLKKKLDVEVKDLFDRYNATIAKSNEVVDLIQETLKCCGTTGRSYWKNQVPNSCPPETNPPGCQSALFDFLLSSMKLIAVVVLVLSVVEVTGAVLALCLASCIRKRDRLTY